MHYRSEICRREDILIPLLQPKPIVQKMPERAGSHFLQPGDGIQQFFSVKLLRQKISQPFFRIARANRFKESFRPPFSLRIPQHPAQKLNGSSGRHLLRHLLQLLEQIFHLTIARLHAERGILILEFLLNQGRYIREHPADRPDKIRGKQGFSTASASAPGQPERV